MKILFVHQGLQSFVKKDLDILQKAHEVRSVEWKGGLGGIVVNNSILLIDHANNLRKRNINHIKAIILASRDRLRPILMTTATTLLGLLPMAISTQEGSNLWSPLAITVMGGLTSSTILTLLIVPNAYIISEDIGVWTRSKLGYKKV